MKTKTKMRFILMIATLSMVLLAGQAWAQRPLQYFRTNDRRGVNVYETSKEDTVAFDDVRVKLGGAFALQFQGLDHENAAGNLVKINNNFNLATANFDIDAQLYDGVRMHLRTFLSSRHHEESWVKGGYLQIDKLDFIKKDFLAGVMKHVTIKVGHMEINYGDTHFRRTDNGLAMYNPFVGEYIMDSYTTEVGGEVYYQGNGFLGMVGLTNGRLNQTTTNTKTSPVILAKLGYDKQLDESLRIRLTGSIYSTKGTNATYLYGGDRAGSRYYNVMDVQGGTANAFSGRINPGMSTDLTAIMINPFVKYKGVEFFGVYENASGRNDAADLTFTGNRTWNQIGAELLYRFGSREQLYVGGRYNTVSGQLPGEENDKVTVDRVNLGGGWFMTNNILIKAEYVNQQYKDYPDASNFKDGKFNGFMIEAAIGF